MFTDANSIEIDDKIKLPPSETLNQLYNLNRNRKGIRILTVAVYVLSVSLTAIILSIYYLFVWDPNEMKTFTHPPIAICDKIVIPELIAIELLNSSTEISAEEFYKKILYHRRQTLMEEQHKEKLKLWQLEQKQLQVNIMLHQQKFINYSNFHKNISVHHNHQLLNNSNNLKDQQFKKALNESNQRLNLINSENIQQINMDSIENWSLNKMKLNNKSTHLLPIEDTTKANINEFKKIENNSKQFWFTIMPQLKKNLTNNDSNYNLIKNNSEDKSGNFYSNDHLDTTEEFSDESESKSIEIIKRNYHQNLSALKCDLNCNLKLSNFKHISRVPRSKSFTKILKLKMNKHNTEINSEKNLPELKQSLKNFNSDSQLNIIHKKKNIVRSKSIYNNNVKNYKNILFKGFKNNYKRKLPSKISNEDYNLNSSEDSISVYSKTIIR